jgi:serine/threonine-protein kinase
VGSLLFTLVLLIATAFVLLNYVLVPRFVKHGHETLIPDVRTLPVTEARAILGSSGLKVVELREMPHHSLPEAYVVEVIPPQGMHVKAGRDVVLTQSTGPRWSEVPVLFRNTVKISEITLREHGLEMGELREEYNDSVPKGLVVASEPGFGTSLEWGDTVVIIVSLGKRLIRVPDLRGMTVRDAREILRELGLVLDTGLILDLGLYIEAQSPPPGREVASGSEISIQVRLP